MKWRALAGWLALGMLGCGGAAASGGSDAGGDGAGGDAGAGDAVPAPPAPPSCDGVPAGCGPDGQASCCSSSVVPGGTFLRDNGVVGAYTATVSDFRLDTYEISVGRFRKFVDGYPGNRPAAGTGANPGNSADNGWDPAWDASLPADQAALIADVTMCQEGLRTWDAGNDALPMNCITWFEAYAFCIWDGGRLPTEAEWNYAAAGGDQQRHYPWSNPFDSEDIDATRAVYDPAPTTAVVGSRSPQGDARWGHADMAGNVWEWNQDWYRGGGYPDRCINCADLTDYSIRVIRGGDFYTDVINLLTSERLYHAPNQPDFGVGARCARKP
jgi:formylglycine-generating enzyme